MRPFLALSLAITLAPMAAGAQSAGGVPAYEPPPPVTIQRDGQVMKRAAKPEGSNAGPTEESLVANFASAYGRNGKPRLALYWNRQLSDTLTEWYSETRMVESEKSSSTMSGEITLNQTSQGQNSVEIQQRVRDQRRVAATESFEWEFQDGFLAPFMESGAQIIDRTAMMRLTGADMDGTGERIVEMNALKGKADLLLEILVSPNWRSSTGYELRSRVLDVNTGRIVAYVNSKGLKKWNPEKQVLATDKGFVDPADADEDDENFGPQGEDKYKATGTGFERRRKPPKPDKIGHDLALNVMNGLMKQWK